MKSIKTDYDKKSAQSSFVPFDGSEERLDRIIRKKMSDGDYLSALQLVNRRNAFFAPTEDSYALQADLYEILEVNSQALKTWYKFLNVVEEYSLPEAYEGLAVNYMNLGKESQAAYYYNLLIRVDDELTEESKMEIVETFSKPKKAGFRVVYPPEKADYSEEIDKGLHALKEGKLTLARQVFERVQKGAKQFRAAQNLIAVTCLLEDKCDEALARCEKLLAENDCDVQANTTYAAVLGQFNRQDEAKEIAKKLYQIETSDTDELYKIATVCCENGLHAEALEKFIRLEEDIRNDANLLYFKAVAAYKSGNLNLSIKTFEKLLTIYPEAAVARFYYDVLRYYRENQDKQDVPMPELSYFYRVPQNVREGYCEFLCFLDKLSVKEAQTVASDRQVLNVLQWCFDEMDGTDGDLQMLGACVAAHCRYTQFVQDILINPDVSDVVKVNILHLLTLQNKDAEYGVVIYHIFRRIHFYRIKLGVKKRKRFLDAYAAVYAKFCILSDEHAKKISSVAELLYNCLVARNATDYIDDVHSVSCAIYLLAGLKEGGSTAKSAAKLFEADMEKVVEILNVVQEVTGQALRESEKRDKQPAKE